MNIFIFLLMSLFLSIEGSRNVNLVIDTSQSMDLELDKLKKNFKYLLTDSSDTISFSLLTFKGGDVQVNIDSSRDSQQVLDAILSLQARGGEACPENSLSALYAALQISPQGTKVLLFTDASASSKFDYNNVVKLCRETHSTVNLFLYDDCSTTLGPRGYTDVYYDVARECRGNVIKMNQTSKLDLTQVIKLIAYNDWSENIVQERFNYEKQLQFPERPFVSEALLVITGDHITSSVGNSDEDVTKVLESENVVIYRFLHPRDIHVYQIKVNSNGETTATFYVQEVFPFQYGFSPKLASRLAETSPKPMPKSNSFIILYVPEYYSYLEPKKIKLILDDIDGKFDIQLRKMNDQFYSAQIYFSSDMAFLIEVTSYDASNGQEVSVVSGLIETQRSEVSTARYNPPTVKLIDEQRYLTTYGSNTRLASKVTGYPEPTISWRDESGTLSSEYFLIEIPNVYISYLTIENVNSNKTLMCTATNTHGSHSQNIMLYVQREYKFEVLEAPIDSTFIYGEEGKLMCSVMAYPEATITWYLNDKRITSSENIIVNEQELIIKSMDLTDVGKYACIINNEVKTEKLEAYVTITGLESPQIHINESNISLQPGKPINIYFSVTGTPKPDTVWKYKENDWSQLVDVAEDVIISEDAFQIYDPQMKHTGQYICTATNVEGTSDATITLELKYAPIINSTELEEIIVREESMVELPCVVQASPKAHVRWELFKNDVNIPFNERHSTDSNNVHRFIAFGEDSGEYTCIAENEVGSASKSIYVNVWQQLYIEPQPSKMVVKAGTPLLLRCNLQFGNPPPSSEWRFFRSPYEKSVLKRGHESIFLSIANVTKANEGTYECFMQNDYDFDSIYIAVKVTE